MQWLRPLVLVWLRKVFIEYYDTAQGCNRVDKEGKNSFNNNTTTQSIPIKQKGNRKFDNKKKRDDTQAAIKEFPTYHQCGKKHDRKCLKASNKCFECGEVGYVKKLCTKVKAMEREPTTVLVKINAATTEEARRNNIV